jgi:hypothetical protein
MGDAPLAGGTVTGDVCGAVRTDGAAWQRSMTAPSCAANRPYRSTALSRTPMWMPVCPHHRPNEGHCQFLASGARVQTANSGPIWSHHASRAGWRLGARVHVDTGQLDVALRSPPYVIMGKPS